MGLVFGVEGVEDGAVELAATLAALGPATLVPEVVVLVALLPLGQRSLLERL